MSTLKIVLRAAALTAALGTVAAALPATAAPTHNGMAGGGFHGGGFHGGGMHSGWHGVGWHNGRHGHFRGNVFIVDPWPYEDYAPYTDDGGYSLYCDPNSAYYNPDYCYGDE